MTPDPIAAAVMKRIHDHKHSLKHVAAQAGVDRSSLSKWLAGSRRIRIDTLHRLLDALDLEIRPKERPHEGDRQPDRQRHPVPRQPPRQ